MNIEHIKPIFDSSNRMARMEAVVFVGLLLGALSSIPLYSRTSAAVVFFCASLCNLCGLVYIYFFVRESIQSSTSDIDFWVRRKQTCLTKNCFLTITIFADKIQKLIRFETFGRYVSNSFQETRWIRSCNYLADNAIVWCSRFRHGYN